MANHADENVFEKRLEMGDMWVRRTWDFDVGHNSEMAGL